MLDQWRRIGFVLACVSLAGVPALLFADRGMDPCLGRLAAIYSEARVPPTKGEQRWPTAVRRHFDTLRARLADAQESGEPVVLLIADRTRVGVQEVVVETAEARALMLEQIDLASKALQPLEVVAFWHPGPDANTTEAVRFHQIYFPDEIGYVALEQGIRYAHARFHLRRLLSGRNLDPFLYDGGIGVTLQALVENNPVELLRNVQAVSEAEYDQMVLELQLFVDRIRRLPAYQDSRFMEYPIHLHSLLQNISDSLQEPRLDADFLLQPKSSE